MLYDLVVFVVEWGGVFKVECLVCENQVVGGRNGKEFSDVFDEV